LLRDIKCKCEIAKNFTPSWFASVMGTGILAMTAWFYSKYLPVLKDAGRGLFLFNVVLFFVLLVPWTIRWIKFRKQAMEDLMNPVVANFYPTISVGMLVLSANFIVIGRNIRAGEVFWFAGAFLTIFFSILVPYIMFTGKHVTLDHINPAWFIPPVGLIVIPIAGSLLIPEFTGTIQELVILLNFFGWGAGFLIYLAILAVCMYRFILHHPLPSILAPTVWINLGPIGAGTVALFNLTKNTDFITVKEPFFIVGLLLWGFGVWWTIMAIVMTAHYLRRLKLPYAMSWWAFTFPLGAYVAACYVVAEGLNLELVNYFGFALFWLLFFFWGMTLFRTGIAAYHGTVFKSKG